MNPSAIPFAMLDVNGMATMTKKAGNDSSKCVQSISLMLLIIILPTMIKLGAVIAATFETAPISGLKKAVIKNRMATTNAVKPVLPPAPTPAEDSTEAAVGLVPNMAPTVVPMESAKKHCRIFQAYYSSTIRLDEQCLIKHLSYRITSQVKWRRRRHKARS